MDTHCTNTQGTGTWLGRNDTSLVWTNSQDTDIRGFANNQATLRQQQVVRPIGFQPGQLSSIQITPLTFLWSSDFKWPSTHMHMCKLHLLCMLCGNLQCVLINTSYSIKVVIITIVRSCWVDQWKNMNNLAILHTIDMRLALIDCTWKYACYT